MIALLVKATIIITVLLAFYKLFLEKESFFAWNRIYLMAGLFLAFSIPYLSIPEIAPYQGYVENLITNQDEITELHMASEVSIEDQDKGAAIMEAHGNAENQEKVNISNVEESTVSAPITKKRGMKFWILSIYFFGVIVLFINLISQIIATLIRTYRNEDKIEGEDGTIVNLASESEPCSFFNYIYIHPDSYDFDTYEQIINHEKIHVKKRHSIDLILAEMAVILMWFNPFIWIYRKEVEKNIEYQTDHLLTKQEAVDEKKEYQMNLLKIATYSQPLSITTNYNQSLIKQRIKKMNAKASNPYSYWKYAFAFPLLFTTLLFLNKPILNAQNTIVSEPSPATPAILDTIPPDNSKSTSVTPEKEKDQETSTNVKISISHTDDGENSSSHVDIFTNEDEEESDCKALIKAILSKDLDKVNSLIPNTDVNCIDPNPGTHSHSNGSYSYYSVDPRTPLVAAAYKENIQVIEKLLAAGADINSSSDGDPLPIMVAINANNVNLVAYLHKKGARINSIKKGEGTPLSVAAKNGHLKIVQYLITQGADINTETRGEGTALSVAAKNGHMDVVKFLISRGAVINQDSPGEGTAISLAARSGNKELVQYLLDQGADINASSRGEGTPLTVTAKSGNLSMVTFLISKGADVNTNSPGEGTPLSVAAKYNRMKIAQLLISKGADVNYDSPGEGTPLIVAARSGNFQMVQYLVEQGADVQYYSNNDGSALSNAGRNGHTEIVKYLKEKGADF